MYIEPPTNIRSTDRLITLSVIDGEKAKSSTGLVDTRLFTGEQQLRLKMEPETCLWYFQYSNNGALPEALRGKYTGFKSGLKHAEDYFKRRNIQITSVRD